MKTGIVKKSLSGNFYVEASGQIYVCRGRGGFRNDGQKILVGDNVEFKPTENNEGYIMKINPRKNSLVRPPIANIDQVIIVMSAKDPDLDLNLLDKLLVTAEFNNLRIVIVINKVDLLNEKELLELKKITSYYEKIGYQIILLSAKHNLEIETLRETLTDKITVFAGQSGVGKSSILNALSDELDLKTNQISQALGRGKHTTRHVELLDIEGGLVADTPGFSKIDFTNMTITDLHNNFIEFFKHADGCKYRSCNHINEDSCEIKRLVNNNVILASRYNNYLKFVEEIKNGKVKY